jgi:hypothetical protein
VGNHGVVEERPLPFPRPGGRLVTPMTPKQRDRLERARRWDARVNAHPWFYAVLSGTAPVIAALVVDAADGVPVTRNIGAAFFGAIVVLVIARYYGPLASRRRVIRLARRYRSAGTEPSG